LIFVTVGSTNFPFDRLFIAIDNALEELKSEAKLVVQMGPSTYRWRYKNIQLYQFLRPKEMKKLFSKADKIITHGGPGTLYSISRSAKCMPLVVARLNEHKEHVNNHQTEYVSYIEKYFPSLYKDFFTVNQNLQCNIRKFIRNQCKENILNRYLFTSNNSLESKLDIYLNTL